jgi:nucleotide-binding universal stress UspA family protein
MGPPVPTSPVPPRQLDLETEEEAQRLVDDAVSQIREQGVEVRGMVLPNQGRIAQQIVEAAEADQATAIVLGSRGMSRLHELMIGSVADKVIRLSKVPVLLVR